MASRILIVDDNPWVRRMVGTMLQRGGHTVDTAGSGEEGLEKATSFAPELIMTDVLMTGMDGWTFVRTLRSHAETSMIPVIFLTALDSEEDRIRGFRLGADDYLAKPFRFEELNLRVERTLRSIGRMRRDVDDLKKTERGAVSLRGDLGQLGVSSLLTILELERKSGVLVLQTATTGRLFMRDGTVVAASIEGDDSNQGAEAVYSMLNWNSGSFQFQALDVDMDDQIQSSTQHLLMEGARRFDEARAGMDVAIEAGVTGESELEGP
jgi:two-component system OmpR family response regulator